MKLFKTLLASAVLGLAGTVALLPPVYAADPPPKEKPAQEAKNIDVVICLDTSNSMDGLIASAKTKLWAIVNDLVKVKPTPNLRVALYSYGNDGYDRNAGWVRKDLDLTTDLDKVSEKLFALTTRGGTEYVARVSRDALDQIKWSEDKTALKLIFVCGNEPASQDPEVTLKSVAEKSSKMGVIINPIYAGNDGDSQAADWKQFATMTGGNFVSINQNGTVSIATPMDKELAELSGKLNTTYVGYGALAKERAANQQLQDSNAGKIAPGAAPDRALSKAQGLYKNSEWDLIDLMQTDAKFDLSKIPEDQLCDEMKKLKPDERLAYLKKKADERSTIQKQIVELGQKRETYIKDEMKKQANAAGKSLDDALRDTLRKQAGDKGIKIPE
jgi:Mg-chelatase subunit ChlD